VTGARWRAGLGAGTALLVSLGLLPALDVAVAPSAVAVATADDAFTLNAADLRFILRQIEIAERHDATATADNPCGTTGCSRPATS
jgi:hypothetical protein